MLKHADIWNAIDRLAYDRGLTASGLARRAGLDPTTFNKSKRVTREGKPRWPSTESIAKILDATGASLHEFLRFITPEPAVDMRGGLPLMSSADAIVLPTLGAARHDHDEIYFPNEAEGAVAVEVADSRLGPAYRPGDIIVISPHAELRRGDRILVRTAGGDLVVGELIRRSGRRVTLNLHTTNGARALSLGGDEISWLARILWASQ